MSTSPVRSHPPIGARRRRFVLERPVDTPDGFGGRLRRFVAGPLVWGAIEFLGGQGGSGRGATHRIRLAFRADLAPPARLAAGTRRFAVQAADDPDGRRQTLVCHVEEILEEVEEVFEAGAPPGPGTGSLP